MGFTIKYSITGEIKIEGTEDLEECGRILCDIKDELQGIGGGSIEFGPVAQLGEQLPCTEKDSGSTPDGSTKWSPEIIAQLEKHQKSGKFHPYTCGIHTQRALKPTENGWVCEEPSCTYKQKWFHPIFP